MLGVVFYRFQTPSERGGIVLQGFTFELFPLAGVFQTPSERGGIVLRIAPV